VCCCCCVSHFLRLVCCLLLRCYLFKDIENIQLELVKLNYSLILHAAKINTKIRLYRPIRECNVVQCLHGQRLRGQQRTVSPKFEVKRRSIVTSPNILDFGNAFNHHKCPQCSHCSSECMTTVKLLILLISYCIVRHFQRQSTFQKMIRLRKVKKVIGEIWLKNLASYI